MAGLDILEREKRIVDKLLAYKSQYGIVNKPDYAFTNIKEAEELVNKDWTAFLFAVIFDQQMPSEKAWSAPFELKKRLGHLDINKIAEIIPIIMTRIKTNGSTFTFVSFAENFTKSVDCKKM